MRIKSFATKQRIMEKRSSINNAAVCRLSVFLLLPIILFLNVPIVSAAAPLPNLNVSEKDQELSRKWDKWLNEEVVYIVSEQEHAIFMKLTSEEQRERFAKEFWLERDPTPGTLKNEYREEHEKRFNYANKFYGRDTFRAGWKTDRGKMHITLGEPREIQRFPSSSNLYSCELWFYQADITKGVPPFFYLLFFKRQNVGELVLYQPGLHTPTHLVAGAMVGQDVYEDLDLVSPELAHAAYTYLVDESPMTTGWQPSMGSMILMAKIANLKNVGIDATYARSILEGIEKVKAQFSFSDFQVSHFVNPYVDDLGNAFIDYAFEYKPEQLDVGQYEDTIYGSMEVVARLADENGTTLLSVQRDVEFSFDESDFEKRKFQPVLFQDRIACLPGAYTLTVTITNIVSKKYYFFSEPVNFSVNRDRSINAGAGNIILARLVTRSNPGNVGTIFPFELSYGRLLPTPLAQFNRASAIYLFCQIYHPHGARIAEPYAAEATLSILDTGGIVKASRQFQVYQNNFTVTGTFDYLIPLQLAELNAGVYSARLNVKFSENNQFVRTTLIELVDTELAGSVPLHSTNAPKIRSDQLLEYGQMMEQQGDLSHAIDFMLRALQADPSNMETRISLSDLYIETAEYNKAIQALEPLRVSEPDNSRMLRNVAEGYLGIQEFGKAAKFLERLRMQETATTELLNMLAECYKQSGKIDKAVEIWNLSLELDPDQPQIQQNVKQ